MANGNFPACHGVTAKWEGGDVNHPKDPGGLTSRGVTQRTGAEYRRQRGLAPKVVTAWSDAEVRSFYESEFWRPMRCEQLAAGVDLCTYDGGVNSGQSRGRRWLLQSIGGSDDQTIKKMCAARLSFVHGLKTFKTFGRGWARRIADIEARAMTMWATATLPDRIAVRTRLQEEGEQAADAAASQNKGAAGAGSGSVVIGTGSTTADAVASGGFNWWLLVAILGIGLVAALPLLIRAMQNRERAAAYDMAALEVAGLKPSFDPSKPPAKKGDWV